MEETTTGEASKPEQADRLIRNHAIAVTAAVALVPIPLLDLPVVTAVQLNLIRSLAKLYEKPFSEQLAKSLLAALMGGSVPAIAASLLKIIPPIGLVGSAAAAAASTYAVGKVFFQHFESGGSFLTFDPEKVRAHYQREIENSPSAPKASPPDAAGQDYGGIKP